MITVNIFDSNFRHEGHSTANQPPRSVEYVWEQTDFDGVTLFTDEWINHPIVDTVRSRYKIGWLREPFCLHPGTYQRALANVDKYDAILTYMSAYFKHPKFRFCPYGGVWIPRDRWGLQSKSKFCSLLVGAKMATMGHVLRRQAAEMFRGRVDVFDSAAVPSIGYGWQTKVQTLRDYAFTIVTETCQEDNLFTEWTLDAMSQGTIPILWGCPNIGEYFNPGGVIQWNTLRQLERIVGQLTMADYYGRWPALAENLATIEKYAVTEDWLWDNLLQDYQ